MSVATESLRSPSPTSPTIRTAQRISREVDETSTAVTDDTMAEGLGPCALAQNHVLLCVALANHWRAGVEFFGKQIDAERMDFRGAGAILMPACEKTRDLYNRVLTLVRQARQTCLVQSEDLESAVRELESIAEWLDTWPTNDPARRQAAREAIAKEVGNTTG